MISLKVSQIQYYFLQIFILNSIICVKICLIQDGCFMPQTPPVFFFLQYNCINLFFPIQVPIFSIAILAIRSNNNFIYGFFAKFYSIKMPAMKNSCLMAAILASVRTVKKTSRTENKKISVLKIREIFLNLNQKVL